MVFIATRKKISREKPIAVRHYQHGQALGLLFEKGATTMRYPICLPAVLSIALLAGFATAGSSQTATQLGGIATMQLPVSGSTSTDLLPQQLPLASVLEGIPSAPELQLPVAVAAPAEVVTP